MADDQIRVILAKLGLDGHDRAVYVGLALGYEFFDD